MIRIALFIGLWFSTVKLYSQNNTAITPQKSITVMSGLMFDNYNSAGFRFYIEYQNQFKKKNNWHWGIGFDTKQAAFRPATDIYTPPELHTQNFSFNIHYHAKVWKDKLLWDIAAGPAVTHAFDDKQNNYLLLGAHIGAHLNLKIGKKVYLETAPLLFIPAGSDFYFMQPKAYRSNYKGYEAFIQYSVLPLGLRFIL